MWNNQRKETYPGLNEIPKDKRASIIDTVNSINPNWLKWKNNKPIMVNGKEQYQKKWSFWARVIYALKKWRVEIIKVFCKKNHKNTKDYI
jgi:hypothetical protein